MARRKEPIMPDSILDQLLAGSDTKTAFESNRLLDQLKKALAERALNAEMDHHLSGDGTAGNSRNGYGRKTVMTDSGSLELSIPRDRQSSFDPQLLAKYQRRFPGFDEKIVSMYARGMNEMKNRGVEDILIAVVDGLKGFPEAINAVFAETTVQTCIVHLLRNSLDFASWKDRKDLARELKSIYGAIDDKAAEAALTISARSIGMGKAPRPGVLVAPPRRLQAVTAGRMGAGRTAIALTSIAMAAKQDLRATPPAQEETSSSHHGGAPHEAPSGLIGEARRNAPIPL